MATEQSAASHDGPTSSRVELRELMRAGIVELERNLLELERASRFMVQHGRGSPAFYDALISAEVLMQLEIGRRRDRLEKLEKMWSELPLVP